MEKISDKQDMVMGFPYTKYDALICDGSVRSGKTSIMSVSFIRWAMESFNHCSFAICGKSVGAVERNIVTPLKEITYIKQRYELRHNRSDHVIIARRGNRENRFYLFGGKDESSASLIQGITLAGVLLDEVALMPRSFVEQALARCSVAGSKLWFNCNPEGPEHWFRKEWILKAKQHNALHLHFTMDDNPSLTDEIRDRYKSMYAGVFYQRYILGLWVMSEGLIYDMFDQTENTYREDIPSLPYSCQRYIACDYGTTNPTVFLDIYDNGEIIRVDREYRWDSRKERRQKTDQEYADDFMEFMGGTDATVLVDPSAASFIVALRQRGVYVREADNDVLDGIRKTGVLLNRREILIHERCSGLIDELGTYLWDEKASLRGEEKPVKQNDHCLAGDTLVDTTDGPIPITELVGKTGKVHCTDGKKPAVREFGNVRMTQEEAEVYEIELIDGKKVKATTEHPILTQRGWVMVKDLRTDDKVACIGGIYEKNCLQLLSAEKNSPQTNILSKSAVPESAELSFVPIRAIKSAGRWPVYNMEVDGLHNFSVNGGIIVHNCVDALRYFVNYLPDWRFEGVQTT